MPFERNQGMLEKIANAIDTFNIKQGEVSSLLVLPLLLVVVYEVVMRYVFNAPTTWGFEATTFLYGIHYMFGLAYCDVTGGHVKVDIFTARAATRTQAILGIFCTLVLFLPVMTCLTIWSFKFAYLSIIGRELNPTSWAPPIYPFKFIMALTLFFLLMQGIANLIHYFQTLRSAR
jgi:TRAP-type mannitol/chloroaromatic compound transport system permease small subunit